MRRLFSIFLVALFLAIQNPLIAQKTIILSPQTTKVKDAVIGSLVPDNNYGKNENIHIYNWTQQGYLNTVRVLIDFDLSVLPKNIVIEEAILVLYYNDTSIYGARHRGENSFQIVKIIRRWDEDKVTWSNQPETSYYNKIFVDSTDNPYQNTVVDITVLAKDAIKSDNFHGFMLKHIDESPYKVNFYSSSDHPDISRHPKLIIKYSYKSETK